MGQAPRKHDESNYPSGKNEFKIVVLGDLGAGKSSLTVQFVQNIFLDEGVDPTIEDSYRKMDVVDDQSCLVEILDTVESSGMREIYYKHGQGFLMVYSITEQSTFDSLAGIYDDILRVKDRDDIPVVLVANKLDLKDQRVISTEQGKKLASQFKGCPFFEISAKDKNKVDDAFHELIRQINRKTTPAGPLRLKK